MKKKLLSLVLAGAMVASTSVSAFATTQDVTTDGGKANVTINGTVLNDQGEAPTGTLKVTIPTAASFTVNQAGKLVVPKQITIQNTGEQGVNVYAESFTDTKPNEGITVVREGDLANSDKTHVSLTIGGSHGTVYLGSEGGSNGLYSKSDFSEHSGEFLLSSIAPGEHDNLTLTGNAGTHNNDLDSSISTNGVSDRFTLVLRIAKTPKA